MGEIYETKHLIPSAARDLISVLLTVRLSPCPHSASQVAEQRRQPRTRMAAAGTVAYVPASLLTLETTWNPASIRCSACGGTVSVAGWARGKLWGGGGARR